MPRLRATLVEEKPGAQLLSGRQVVRVADTRISISTDPPGANVIPIGCRAVLVQADPTNVGIVAVGDAMVTILPARGAQLAASASVPIGIDDVSKVFVNGALGDGVCWLVIR